MATKFSTPVADLSAEQRRVVESLIGLPLSADQVVCWAVMSPDRTPTSADKVQARAGLQELFAKTDQHAAQ